MNLFKIKERIQMNEHKHDRIMVNAQGAAGTNFIEMSEESMVVASLNDLIATNRGIMDIYKTSVERLENEANKEPVRLYIEQHKKFVSELSNIVVSYGGDPETNRTPGSLVTQAWVTLKAAVTEGDGPILAAVAEDTYSVLETYGEILAADLPDDVRKIVQKQMSESRLSHETLSRLSAAYHKS
jgi:uncharacterized protein (TIGR02284 family)